ncbi:MAG: hypothetical protein QOG64_260 [Acidimicrobiaceae bacterium]|nr:hypothetical protein [Acidimicrobiaceae bacterium]
MASDLTLAGDKYRRAVLAVPGTVVDFVRYALGTWPQSGWQMGRGDAEHGEAEGGFAKSGVGGGAFRATARFCDASWTQLTILYLPAGG